MQGRNPSFARRIAPAVAVAGLTGIFFRTLDNSGTGGSLAGGVTSATTTPTATTQPQQQLPNGGFPGDDDNNFGDQGGGQVAPAPTTTVPATPGCTSKSGPVVGTRWGDVQVVIAVDGAGKICSSNAPITPAHSGRSVFINEQAVPILNQETLQAQSANIDMVSGATVTSEGYIQSLQALLNAK